MTIIVDGTVLVTIINMLLFFSLYSFLGWIIETVFRSITQRRFVNAGFLYGPFVPLYGFGALVVINLHEIMYDSSIFLSALTYGLLISGMEYLTGVLLEAVFGIKLWEYSDNDFNLHGRICLTFSLFWTGLALLLALFIHPFIDGVLALFPARQQLLAAVLLTAYFLVDMAVSVTTLASFKKQVLYFSKHYLSLGKERAQRIFEPFGRLLDAFPRLRVYVLEEVAGSIMNRIGQLSTVKQETSRKTLREERTRDEEYLRIVGDIERNDEFQRLRNYRHHDDTILNHVQVVSYISYLICRRLGLDYRSAARGGLLHDFFLYDWRNHDAPELPKEKNHGIEHPRIALENAGKHFMLNGIERDIIAHHMWPLTLVPPKHKEAYIVTFVDKFVATREFLKGIGKK